MKSEHVSGFLATATATAAIASIALLQKKRASVYDHMKPKQRGRQRRQSAPVNGHKHLIMTPKSRILDDPSEGYELFPIDFSMHVQIRQNAVYKFLETHPEAKNHASVMLLHGGVEVDRYDTDIQYNFHQESFFQYLFGVRESGCAGLVDLTTHKAVLFVPRLSDEWELWCGDRKPLAYFKAHYKVDDVYFMDEIATVMSDKIQAKKLYVLHGQNTDSGLETTTTSTFEGIDKFDVDKEALHPVLVECRVIKTEKELELLRFVNKLSSRAHINVMKNICSGKMEFHAESDFLHYVYSNGGARFHAYTCICGSGHNASALHYGHAGAPNDKLLEDGDLFLNDMGGELHGYTSDITCTWPVNGVFSADQRVVYKGVLKSHDAVMDAIKPGVSYVDLHLLSHRVLTQHLLEHGLFQNGTTPTTLGGIPMGYIRSTKKILAKLRCVRNLAKNMVLTVEPGCYFIEAHIQAVLANPVTAKFINQEMLSRFRGTGGVRIESDVIVTETGVECMSQVPRTVEEIEATMQKV
ncbi:unnamed protein product [Peronospora belbahrii]|uniref:Xaa-Pro dipeptidase n=1 Tax=Peronospora belbahrii TaxID=622444 RepID=A0AAU9LQF0_9STRA|nr:unnamed protein product [Peronospora belbahrii]